ncbi:MAG TPA: GNAT family N-acetyltransferase [Chthoniobacterales bacterium]
MIRPVQLSDASEIATIYNHYIAHTIVTFELEPVSPAEMAARIEDTLNLGFPWLVVGEDCQEHAAAGYAYARPWRPRAAYAKSAETSVYLHPNKVGRGYGSALYKELLPLLHERGFHAVIGGVSLPNAASVALHEKFGFEKVAHFRETGRKLDRWIDVGYWQLIF